MLPPQSGWDDEKERNLVKVSRAMWKSVPKGNFKWMTLRYKGKFCRMSSGWDDYNDNNTYSRPLADAFVAFPALSSNFMAHKSWAKLLRGRKRKLK